MLLEIRCRKCKYINKELKDGWHSTCKAYPNGIPGEVMRKSYEERSRGCANGYAYVESDFIREQKAKKNIKIL